MPDENGIERRKPKTVRPVPPAVRWLVDFSRNLWLDYLRRGIARPGELATMAAEIRTIAHAESRIDQR